MSLSGPAGDLQETLFGPRDGLQAALGAPPPPPLHPGGAAETSPLPAWIAPAVAAVARSRSGQGSMPVIVVALVWLALAGAAVAICLHLEAEDTAPAPPPPPSLPDACPKAEEEEHNYWCAQPAPARRTAQHPKQTPGGNCSSGRRGGGWGGDPSAAAW